MGWALYGQRGVGTTEPPPPQVARRGCPAAPQGLEVSGDTVACICWR